MKKWTQRKLSTENVDDMSEFPLILCGNLTDIGSLIDERDVADDEGIALVRNASILDDENRAGRQDVAFLALPQQSVAGAEFVDFARQPDVVAHADAEVLGHRREIGFLVRRVHLLLLVVVVAADVGRLKVVVIVRQQRLGRRAQYHRRQQNCQIQKEKKNLKRLSSHSTSRYTERERGREKEREPRRRLDNNTPQNTNVNR